jgi:hypothetical protein
MPALEGGIAGMRSRPNKKAVMSVTAFCKGNKKAVGSLKRSPRLPIISHHALLAVDKPLPMAVLPPPKSHAVDLVCHHFCADPF